MALRCVSLAALAVVAAGAGSKAKAAVQLRSSLRGAYANGSPSSDEAAAARTLITLDTNHDGMIDPHEISAFAKAQGLDANTVSAEFGGLDTNGDGMLDRRELAAALGTEQQGTAPLAQPAPLGRFDAEEPETSSVQQVQVLGRTSATPSMSTSADSAQMVAESIVSELSAQEDAERQAQSLERLAAELKANSTALARRTIQKAVEAGSHAAVNKAHEILHKLVETQKSATDAEVQSAMLHAKAKAEMLHADMLMTVANEALSGQEAAKPIANSL